jgi:hypothetical protein
VADSGGADSMFQFWLEREGDKMKHCQKMKQRQRACLALWEGSVTRRGGMAMSARGEAAPGRGKGGDDAS